MMRLDLEADQGRCLCCGSHVTAEFRRGSGDQDDRAHRCLECDIVERISRGTAAGKDVDHPDPLEEPSRFAESFENLPERIKTLCQPVATDGGES